MNYNDIKNLNISKRGKKELLNALNKGGGSGAGVIIVDSVDKLDKNAPVGTPAVVIEKGKIEECSLDRLVQPTADLIDMTTFDIKTDGLSLVKGINIIPPTSPINAGSLYDFDLMFVTENLNLQNPTSGAALTLSINIKNNYLYGISYMYMDMTNQIREENDLFTYNESNQLTIYEENINKLNSYFQTNNLYYISALDSILQEKPLTRYYEILTDIIKAVSGIPSEAYLFIKKDDWKPYLIEDVKKALNKAENLNLNKQDKIEVHNIENSYANIQPNTYNIIARSSSGMIYLPYVGDADFYEIIIEFTNTGDTSFSIDFSITINWANNLPPVVSPGQTIIMSIVRGFGVWSEFIKE